MNSKKLIKIFNRMLKNDHLYTDDEIRYIKTQLNEVKIVDSMIKSKSNKGFGNK